jgi:hypothetical protein
VTTPSSGTVVTVITASCPTGKKVLGGGFSHPYDDSVQILRSSWPTNGTEGWQVEIRTTSDAIAVAAYALCAFAP